jgi:hypothetical protein
MCVPFLERFFISSCECIERSAFLGQTSSDSSDQGVKNRISVRTRRICVVLCTISVSFGVIPLFPTLTTRSVQPFLRDPTHVIATTTHHDLLTSLKTTVLGISSQLHIWNSNLERFLQADTEKQAKVGILLVDGKDNIVSQRWVLPIEISEPWTETWI